MYYYMDGDLFMDECLYCGKNKFEYMYSLKHWTNGKYCSLRCLYKDIESTEFALNFYSNEIESIRRDILNEKSKEEVNKLNQELDNSKHKRVVLLQKLNLMKSLIKSGQLKYNK